MEPKMPSSCVRDVVTGMGVVIMMPSNVYEALLEDEVFIGPFCEVQRGVRIGRRTRVQSHAVICELVSIGEDCFIGHGVICGNLKRSQSEWRFYLGSQGETKDRDQRQWAQEVADRQHRLLR